MKVLVIGPVSSPIIKRLSRHLKNIGHDVLVASHNAEKLEGVINLGKINSFLGYLYFLKVNKIVRDFQPDIVHAHIVNHYGLMAVMQPRPLVVALWGSDIMLAPHSGHLIKRLAYRIINWIVLKRANRCHTSGEHVAEEADKQCKGVKNKTDVFYWGFPLERPDEHVINAVKIRLELEFGLQDKGFIVFPRGLGWVYNPKTSAKIINKFLEKKHPGKKIVVLKGFASEEDERQFKSMVDLDHITFINRLLNSDELYYLYSKTDVHFSIPSSDSLGGGVVEPALFGSFPVLSNLPSYKKYLEKNSGLILRDYNNSSIECLYEVIKNGEIGKSEKNVPKFYTLKAVLSNFNLTYLKAKA